MKKLIVTGDDFGASIRVNEAIEEAHRCGILTTASLMVGETASADAVERARRLPSLRIGLHLVLVEGAPVSPVEIIPDLVDREGRFSSHLFRAGFRLFSSKTVKTQAEAEVRAQFKAFQATGLPLDHVNSHHHFHLHPSLSRVLLEEGREYGVTAVRLPYEPPIPSWRASRTGAFRKTAAWPLLYPWLALLKGRLRRQGVRFNDFLFGMKDSGKMNADLVLRFLAYLPNGVTEIYFHPGAGASGCGEGAVPSRRELETLTNPELSRALSSLGIERIAFSDL